MRLSLSVVYRRGWWRHQEHWSRRLDVSKQRPRGAHLNKALQDPKYRTRLCSHWENSQVTFVYLCRARERWLDGPASFFDWVRVCLLLRYGDVSQRNGLTRLIWLPWRTRNDDGEAMTKG